MTRRVLDVGNCDPDYMSIAQFLQTHFAVEVDRAHALDDTLTALRTGQYCLMLVNRKLDCDYSDGIEIIRRVKADQSLANVPAMLVTNYSEHQDAAVAIGAERGFGKLEFNKPETVERLTRFLG
ncbi:MAG: hypothetical protein KDA42_02935 [Planctomycetales bacterium]|nr:hypothetical protein [Planctomycetales bacterium]